MVMSSWSVNLLTLFLGRLSPLSSTSKYFVHKLFVHKLSSETDYCPSRFVCIVVLWPSQPNGVMSSAFALLLESAEEG